MFEKFISVGLLCLALIKLTPCTGQGDPVGGARSAALGSASLTMTDVWSCFNNQSGLGGLEKVSAGIFVESRFLIKEMSTRGLALAIPTGSGVFGLSASNYGYSLYQESDYGISYGRKLGEDLTGGMHINYLTTRIGEGYGSRSSLAFQLGFQYALNEHVILAVHAANPSRAKRASFNDERYPSILRMGGQYRFSDKTMMVAEVMKELENPAAARAGIEYQVLDNIILRAGVGGNDFQTSFGIGLKFDDFRFDLASSYHPQLGYSPQVSVNYDVP